MSASETHIITVGEHLTYPLAYGIHRSSPGLRDNTSEFCASLSTVHEAIVPAGYRLACTCSLWCNKYLVARSTYEGGHAIFTLIERDDGMIEDIVRLSENGIYATQRFGSIG